MTTLILSMLGLFAAPAQASPAAFWQQFMTNYLAEDNNSQISEGGYRAMYWQAPNGQAFTVDKVLAFAKKHNWQLVGNESFSSQQIKNWTFEGQPFFPLTPHGLEASGKVEVRTLYQYRWIQDDMTVYKFKTGTAVTDPKTGRKNDLNGFVVFNKPHTQLCVYHIWGQSGGEVAR